LRTWTGRLRRDIERKTAGEPDLVGVRAFVLDLVKRPLARKRDDKNKLYAPHGPKVECIAKAKARTRHEFGVNVSIAGNNARRRRSVRARRQGHARPALRRPHAQKSDRPGRAPHR
jgi:IS5 family transposase